MSTVTYPSATATIDGTFYPTFTIEDWAQLTLTGDDLASFNAAKATHDATFAAAVANGDIIVNAPILSDTPSSEQVVNTEDTNNPIPIFNEDGSPMLQHYVIESSFTIINQPPADPTWLAFWDRFLADSRITFPPNWGQVSA